MVSGDAEGSGALADWDHSRFDHNTRPPGQRKCRTVSSFLLISCSFSKTERCDTRRKGTWRFRSIRLLDECRKAHDHDILDEYESVFWVLLHVAARYFKYDGRKASTVLRLFDDSSSGQLRNGMFREYGSQDKRVALIYLPDTVLNFASAPLNKLISRIAGEWDKLYSRKEDVLRASLKMKMQLDADAQSTASTTVIASHKPSQRRQSFDDDAAFGPLEIDDDRECLQQDLTELRERLKAMQTSLRNPLFWINLFENAACKPGWDLNDILPTNRFLPGTSDAGATR